ncbi:HutD family protein [uncultured Aquincola sp.]|uniref:HutD/Ves family protein n=1 Tax=uncultured Aquincola sp. TaxID=886556 RepID=UPI0032B168D6
MSIQLIDLFRQPPEPWRNGGGHTRELLRRPGAPGADWALRISVADIDRDGDFSAFPGVQRWFAVLEGAGVELTLPAGRQRLTAASPPLAFDGAEAPGCRLLAGPTRDLNLMVQHGRGTMRPVQPGVEWSEPFEARGLFSLSGGLWHPREGKPVVVAPFTLLWADDGMPCRFDPVDAPADGRPCGYWLGHAAC